MRRRLALGALQLALTGCERVSDLGGAALPVPSCAGECSDAGMDAGPLTIEAGPERPGPRYESADAATLTAFAGQLEGLWHGVSTDVSSVADEVGPRFEVTFTAGSGLAQGSFVVRCVDGEGCDPFGSPGPADDAGTYRLVDVGPGAVGRARGDFSWISRFGASFEAPFWQLRRDETANGPVVTFDLGGINRGPTPAVERRVVLAAGPWPDAGAGDAGAVDSGLRDGSVNDAGFGDAGGGDGGTP